MTNHNLSATLKLTAAGKELVNSKPFPVFDYTEHAYFDILEGKTVVIVGGCDNFDKRWIDMPLDKVFVVRINNHPIRQGGICDALYHAVVSADFDPSLLTLRGLLSIPYYLWLNQVDTNYEYGLTPEPEYLDIIKLARKLSPRTEVGLYAAGTWRGDNPYGAQYEWLNTAHKYYNSLLFTGLIAALHVFRSRARNIYLMGMDLYAAQTKGKKGGVVNNHSIDSNVNCVWELARSLRVCLDTPLIEALKMYGCDTKQVREIPKLG